MIEMDDEEWALWCDEKSLREYEIDLARHPHPSDPDHPRKCDYGLEDDPDEE